MDDMSGINENDVTLFIICHLCSNNPHIHLIIQDTFIYVMKHRWSVFVGTELSYRNCRMKIGIAFEKPRFHSM